MGDLVTEVPILNVEEIAEEGFDDWASYYSHFIQSIRSKYFPIDVHDPDQEKLLKKLRYSLELMTSIIGGEILDIILQTRSHQTKLRIDLRRFLLVGYMIYHPHESGSQWFEFGYHHTWRKNPPTHQISGSSFLDLHWIYSCILREVGEGVTLHDMLFGQQQLISAVDCLAMCSSMTSNQEIAWSLVVVKVMICEAIRFTAVSNHLAVTGPCIFRLPSFLINWIRIHESCTMGLVACPSSHEAISGTWTFMLQNLDDYCRGHHRFGCLQIESGPGIGVVTSSRGRQKLLEVFSVCVSEINGKTFGAYFYGTISLIVGFNIQHIYYNRKREEPDFIYPGDNLLLTGPRSCIPVSTGDEIGFDFAILGKRIQDPFGLTQIDWVKNRYDKPISDQFVTDECSLTLNFIVLSDAVQATVEVTINGAAHVYGKVHASSAEFADYDIMLFQKTQLEKLQVCPDVPLKLSRSTVAVPYESSLIIQVELDSDGDGQEFSFAKGTVKFPFQLSGSSLRKIAGDCGETQVRVSWV